MLSGKDNGLPLENLPEAEAPQDSFPVVGIGASAGGLEALQLFLRNIPEKSGMAYVVVQHLDPTRKGFLVDLLKRATAMPVFQVEEGVSVQPNCVFVIPPNKDMHLFHGKLHLFDPVAPRGLRLPIDFLFRSLADDQQEQAIGVILSGMGTDGTLGLKAIKEKGGAVFAQEPTQSKFNGMPKSAIATGLIDVVADAEKLPSKIIAYLKHGTLTDKPELDLEDKDRIAFEKIVSLLRSETGHDFSLYKKSTVYRRIDRRLSIHQINDLATYIRFLQENPQELQVLFKELLIGVTSFFRDPEAWEQLKEQVFPELFGHAPNKLLRAWVPGCSTGEEAYSMAIIFKEALDHVKPTTSFSLQIFATDLDSDAVEKARQGFYTPNIAADVSAERLQRFFIQEEHGYRVRKEIRDMIVFAPQNVIMDPPFTKIDVLACRNLLIYLTSKLQGKLFSLFHYSLNTDGFLFLGSSETVSSFTDFFEPLKGKGRFYRRIKSTLDFEPLDFPASVFSSPPGAAGAAINSSKTHNQIKNLEELANEVILQHHSPTAVLVNEKGDILYTRGKISRYLEPAAGKANWNIFAMTYEGLHKKLSRAFKKALRQKSVIILKKVKIVYSDREKAVDVTIQPLKEPEALQRLVMVTFKDVKMFPKTKEPGNASRTPSNKNHVAELELELEQSRRELSNLRREMQTSQEEYLSAYEELQSTNEELQSTNEEITTSKEELQSLNEELQTVNCELQTKVDELSCLNNDMKNLLDSTDIATLFLDNELCVRRFTPETAKIIKLIQSDVGRPITDIVSNLTYPELEKDAREVLRTLIFSEKMVSTSDGYWFKVRIMPYRTLEDKIDGLVITFADITDAKMLENALRETGADLEKQIANKNMKLNKAEEKLQTERKQNKEEKNAKGTTKSSEKPKNHHKQE